ncbi:trans-aconitate 2-methyltransferase [Streptomyces sp. B1866]|uniref:trans-aconitate 2-methyltransferase n=1 Tax=Streptomyces sp. B1866 TaxID=3075431 RepID=UPI00288F0584|nr:trans-aconitate 2-methyltransferase [Streptomyces sp. B1866]MDT3397582.1 trans-aconitate 2-methyltransferase [Streptomyces sp. B1866]
MSAAPRWDPGQYLRYADVRARPFHDLLARVPDPPADRAPGRPRVADLGCGPGHLTALLADRWPAAHVTGLDTSPEMLREAEAHAGPTPGGGRLGFQRADVLSWTPDGPYDLIVSNATLQWVPGHADRFGTWLDALRPGGTLAFQVPGNFTAPSHALLADLCAAPRWRGRVPAQPAVSAVLDPADYLDRLTGLGCAADVWETTYLLLLTGPDPVLDWVKGTALRPALTALAGDPEAERAFLAEYRDLLRAAYPPGRHGTVFPFRRVFAVATKPAG